MSLSTADRCSGTSGYYQVGNNYGKQTKRSTETRESVELNNNNNVLSLASMDPGDTF